VIINGIVTAEELAPAPWDSLVAVALGTPVPEIRIHAVDSDPGQGVEMAWKALAERGCRRIAFVHLAEYRHIHNAERCGRFLWLQDQAPAEHQRLPIVHGTFSRQVKPLQDRIRALAPDGLIGVNDWVYWVLKEDGWRIPRQLQYVSLARNARDSQTAGMNTEDVEQARAGVELLDLLIARRTTGLPLTPRTIRVAPTWCDGPTLRPPN